MARDTDSTAAETNGKNVTILSSLLKIQRPSVDCTGKTVMPEAGEFLMVGGWGEVCPSYADGNANLFATYASGGGALRMSFRESGRHDRMTTSNKRVSVIDGECVVELKLYNFKSGVPIVPGDLVFVRGNRSTINGGATDYRWIADIVSKSAIETAGWVAGVVQKGATASQLVAAASGSGFPLEIKLYPAPIMQAPLA